MHQPTNRPRVAVITSTIGRQSLVRAIQSVAAQTYPATHYVFVDGSQYHAQAAEILEHFPHVKAVYLPMNTGANGITNGRIHAAAAFLVEEEIFCYLDDDNWYEPYHIEQGVAALLTSSADYAYALRNYCDHQGSFVCVDCLESLGDLPHGLPPQYLIPLSMHGQSYQLTFSSISQSHIDTNCYFITRETAQLLGQAWKSGIYNDRQVYATLQALHKHGVCTRSVSVNYTLDITKFMGGILDFPLFAELTEAEKLALGYDLLRWQAHYALVHWGGDFIWHKLA